MAVTVKQKVRFGPFVLDVHSGELHKNGSKLKVQPQPIQVLTILLEHPGELVTREEIRTRIWPSDTFVDFEHGLNTAVKKLRQALGDESETPAYIQTLPRRGYRFTGSLEEDEEYRPQLINSVSERTSADAVDLAPSPPRPNYQKSVVTVGLAAIMLATVVAVG